MAEKMQGSVKRGWVILAVVGLVIVGAVAYFGMSGPGHQSGGQIAATSPAGGQEGPRQESPAQP
ncbi:hypothetical protein [Caulobacter sp. NIBR2454]|uniref:hypothetical protein n=1 Tax=Caulobacter sp. NIBR2454 TaxID=3015996 RepID=UPI0022B64C5F|nr:hypothetical protein [Caulobacter sp. NIBR2454]